jgi:glyoxylase-like metal-dependent hydrolase (beta-lactamase superfamily II)
MEKSEKRFTRTCTRNAKVRGCASRPARSPDRPERAGRQNGPPTFPRARYLISRAEFEVWKPIPRQERLFVDSLDPVAVAGQLELVEMRDEGTEVAPGLFLRPAPGHTAGQLAVEVSDSGRSGLIGGDWIHHPAQLVHRMGLFGRHPCGLGRT